MTQLPEGLAVEAPVAVAESLPGLEAAVSHEVGLRLTAASPPAVQAIKAAERALHPVRLTPAQRNRDGSNYNRVPRNTTGSSCSRVGSNMDNKRSRAASNTDNRSSKAGNNTDSRPSRAGKRSSNRLSKVGNKPRSLIRVVTIRPQAITHRLAITTNMRTGTMAKSRPWRSVRRRWALSEVMRRASHRALTNHQQQ